MIITAWSAMSPHGTDTGDVASGMVSRRPLADGPRPVPDFDPRSFLGRQGTRTMNRATALAVANAARLRADDDEPSRVGVVLGTTNGSAQSILDLNRDSLTAAKPYHIPPSTILNAAMNGVAGQCAIWHGLKGPNATLAAGRPTVLLALGYCRRLLMTGRADAILAGAAEELSEARSWSRDPGMGQVPLAEGCAMLRLVPAAAEGLAEVTAVTSTVVTDGDIGSAVTRAAHRALSRTPGEPLWAALGSGMTGDAEFRALTAVCRPLTPLPPMTESLGQAHSATGSFQMAALLSHAAADPGSGGRLALLTAVEPAGVVAAAVVRITGGSGDA
jgi:3-oxoacyl-[acyl-carrier-protein] synthase II